jgi:hypothetical protein
MVRERWITPKAKTQINEIRMDRNDYTEDTWIILRWTVNYEKINKNLQRLEE